MVVLLPAKFLMRMPKVFDVCRRSAKEGDEVQPYAIHYGNQMLRPALFLKKRLKFGFFWKVLLEHNKPQAGLRADGFSFGATLFFNATLRLMPTANAEG